jgi:hypothetical protein
MDPLRFRQRKLFRQAAIDNFVGAFGDSGMPELLMARHLRLALFGLSVLFIAVVVWGFTASLPVRVTLTGKLVGAAGSGWCFLGDSPVKTIQPGQTARIAIAAVPSPVMLEGVVAEYSPELCGLDATDVGTENALIILRPGKLGGKDMSQSPASIRATAWVTVGRQALWIRPRAG